MRYIARPTDAELADRAQKYVGHRVKDTRGREGVVESAWLVHGNRVAMSVRIAGNEDIVFFTTNEFATIVRERDND